MQSARIARIIRKLELAYAADLHHSERIEVAKIVRLAVTPQVCGYWTVAQLAQLTFLWLPQPLDRVRHPTRKAVWDPGFQHSLFKIVVDHGKSGNGETLGSCRRYSTSTPAPRRDTIHDPRLFAPSFSNARKEVFLWGASLHCVPTEWLARHCGILARWTGF